MLGISNRGDVYLRKILIHGARAAVLRIKRDRRRSERGWMRSMPALRKTSSWSPWPINWRASHGLCYPAEKTTDQTTTWSQHRELARKRRLRLGSADALPLFYVIPGLIPIGSGLMKNSSATKRPLLYRRNPNGIRRYAHRAKARRRLEPWARKECPRNAALQSSVVQLDIGCLRVRGQIHDH